MAEILPLTIFLAKLIGLVFFIYGFALIFRIQLISNAFKEISTGYAHILWISFMPLIAGSAMIISHNIWVSNWTAFVTFLGWLMFASGIFRMFFYQTVMKMCGAMADKKGFFIVSGIIAVIIGGYLLYQGFML